MFNKKTEEEENSFWLSYTDLITGFMVVFIILVLWSTTQNKEKVEVESKYKELTSDFERKFKNTNDVEVTKPEGTLRFTSKTLLFKDDEEYLTEDFRKKLDNFIPIYFNELYEIWKKNEENVFIKEIRIEGHASSQGNDYVYNLNLSSKRALEVYKYILNSPIYKKKYSNDFKSFIKKQTISCGYSFSRPLNSKGTEKKVNDKEDFNKSRRVEFRVLLEHKKK